MATGWLRGRVKAVTSGDCLVIMGNVKSGPPPEKTITLSSLMAPKLARRDGKDEPFAWESREYLRKKCIGKDVVFRVDYAVPSINREFGSVFLGEVNLALAVVSDGWAKLRLPPGWPNPTSTDVSPYINDLVKAEEVAKDQGLGLWNKTPGAAEAAIRDLPPSGVGGDSLFDAADFVADKKGLSLPAVVEHVRDGSTLRLMLLPSFQFVQLYLAGVQCPSAGRRPFADAAPVEASSNGSAALDSNGTTVAGVPSAAQRLAASTAAVDVQAEPFALEAKHFSEIRCLNRDVRVVIEGADGKGSNLVGSVFFSEGEAAVDLSLELIKEGLGKYVEWSANMLEPSAKTTLKAAELEAKKQRLRLWANFVPPPSNSTAIKEDDFMGKVIEVVSGDCIVVLPSSAPADAPPDFERRVNLSSIRARKMGNPKRDEKPEPYAREAKEFLRSRLIGQQVRVHMEYTRVMPAAEGSTGAPASGRTMEFGSVFLKSSLPSDAAASEGSVPALAAAAAADSAPAAGAGSAASKEGINVAEMLVARGFATVVRHRDFEERSTHYDALLAAETRAVKGKKNIHSSKDSPAAHINDLSLPGMGAKARAFLPFLQRAKRMSALVDFVLSGHRFKLLIPKESCALAFSLSGVRCPGRGEAHSEEAIALMRRTILQHEVEIEVETVDKTGTFIGSLWVADSAAKSYSRTNVGALLLAAGLASLHPSFAAERTAEGALLLSAQQQAKNAKLKIWKNFVESKEDTETAAAAGGLAGNRKQEVLQVQVTEVMGGGRFYVVPAGDRRLAVLEAAMKDFSIAGAANLPPINFEPKKGDLVLSQFSADGSWARALVVDAPRGSNLLVFYVDYGNEERVPLSSLRAIQPSVAAEPGLAQLCSLAHIRVPDLEQDFGIESAEFLQGLVFGKTLVARIEGKDLSGGKVKGQGTGPLWSVTLVDTSTSTSVNAAMLQAGLARLEKRSRRESPEKATVMDSLQEHQNLAKKERTNMWQYGDVDSDDEEEFRGGKPRR